MAEQVLIQSRADKALKQEVARIYEALGMDLPTAFRMCNKKTLYTGEKNGLFLTCLAGTVIYKTRAESSQRESSAQ